MAHVLQSNKLSYYVMMITSMMIYHKFKVKVFVSIQEGVLQKKKDKLSIAAKHLAKKERDE